MSALNFNLSLRNRKIKRIETTDHMPLTPSTSNKNREIPELEDPVDDSHSGTNLNNTFCPNRTLSRTPPGTLSPLRRDSINEKKDINLIVHPQTLAKVRNSDVFDFPSVSSDPPLVETHLLTLPAPQPRSKMAANKYDYHRAQNMIPEFTGIPEQLPRFLKMIELHFKRAKTLEEQSDLLDVIFAKITDRAFTYTLRYNEYSDWPSLKQDLTTHFNKQRSSQVIQDDFNNLKLSPNQTLESYSEKAERLLEELNLVDTCEESSEGSLALRRKNRY